MGPGLTRPPGTTDTDEASAGAAAAAGTPQGSRATARRPRPPGQVLWWLGFLLVPIAWAILATVSSSRFVPGPVDVARAVWPMIQSGELTTAVAQSFTVLFLALALGVVLGLAIGMAMGRSPLLFALLDPYVAVIYTVPSIAVIPILVVVLGWGVFAKVVIVSFLVLLPVVIHAATGIRKVSQELIEVSAVFCGGRVALWRDILIPAALPSIFPGLRIGAARALTGLIVAELSTLATGLGFLINRHAVNFDMAESTVPVVVLSLTGFVLKVVLDRAERTMIPWALRK